ncbi:MAG: RsmB/NOP family class I SAM-dependent RNA methyltransferase, partial [Candidatus Eisenbacteria bacterium]|nr:RsmB/NOP family class I SAM-dependent RNA methyltransferase [Candidatus Eisenbacteria bacterium]
LRELDEEGISGTPMRWARCGVVALGPANLIATRAFKRGGFELQDEGSQLVSELVAPPPGGRVLDACAGSGGKTLHLGALLQGKGRIAAVGVGPSAVRQLGELRRRCERAGLHNVQVFWIDEGDRVSGYDEVDDPVVRAEDGSTVVDDPRVRAEDESTVVDDPSEVVTRDVGRTDEAETARWPASLPTWLGKTDRVLIDAPCSGLGVLRRNPDTRFRLTPETIPRLAALQLSILERFAPFVKPGGRLVYATCSVLHEENDAVVASFLGGHPEFTVMPAKEILGKPRALRIGDGTVLRLNPAEHGTDGFFAVVLRRG